MTKVVAISDIHGYLPNIDQPFDLLLICGDVCPVYEPHTKQLQDLFMRERFTKWVNNLPFKDEFSKVVMVFGNHDFFDGESFSKPMDYMKLTSHRLVILEDQEYTFKNLDSTIRIYGTPWCKLFGDWAYMREDKTLDTFYSHIPDSLDILLSHDAADINDMGLIKDGRWGGINAGNKVLAKWVLKKKPKYYFCGHIHTGTHHFTEIEGIKMANVSMLNESYKPYYEDFKPKLIFNFETGELCQ